MTFKDIVATINRRLAGEMLVYNEVKVFLDATIDDINVRLNTIFPVFSELADDVTEYTAIPDKYIRTVVIPGAVNNFYTMDEEGLMSSPAYQQEYITNLFYMERDYLLQVPEEYLAPDIQGTYSFENNHPLAELGGLDINGSFNF